MDIGAFSSAVSEYLLEMGVSVITIRPDGTRGIAKIFMMNTPPGGGKFYPEQNLNMYEPLTHSLYMTPDTDLQEGYEIEHEGFRWKVTMANTEHPKGADAYIEASMMRIGKLPS